jgi:hypothetical protein
MMKRVMIGLVALVGVALWWTDARTQCAGGVGTGGSCRTSTLLGRSLACVTRTLEPGSVECEFFGTQGPNCTHNFTAGVLDCDCRIKGTAYCVPSGSSSFLSFSAASSSDDDDDDGGAPVLKKKAQTLPAGLQVDNIGDAAATTESSGGDPQTGDSYWAVRELEPPSSCVSCPSGTSFLTFLADRVVMRTKFCPTSGDCHTTIQDCRRVSGDPTQISSYNCQTVFECEGEDCPDSESNTTGTCTAGCEED